MPKRTYRKKSGKKGSRKGSKKSYRKKGSKKGSKKSRRLSRFKVDPSNRCSTNKKAQCLTDPNCTYVKKRGCRSRQGTISDNLVFEGPMGPPAGYVPSMRIKKGRKGSKKSRKGSKKSYRKKGSKKSYRKKGSKKSRKGSKKSRGKKYSKRR
jgi:hypothetical protein